MIHFSEILPHSATVTEPRSQRGGQLARATGPGRARRRRHAGQRQVPLHARNGLFALALELTRCLHLIYCDRCCSLSDCGSEGGGGGGQRGVETQQKRPVP